VKILRLTNWRERDKQTDRQTDEDSRGYLDATIIVCVNYLPQRKPRNIRLRLKVRTRAFFCFTNSYLSENSYTTGHN